MKHFILMLTAFMFLANIFVVSAWAKPCMDMEVSSSFQQDVDRGGEMPCHGDQEQDTSMQHCDGVCLCLHVSINQIPVLDHHAAFSVPAPQAEQFFSRDTRVAFMATAPPQRPPKFNS